MDTSNFAIGVGLLSRKGFCLSGKANLHPLVFYTINVTSRDEYIRTSTSA